LAQVIEKGQAGKAFQKLQNVEVHTNTPLEKKDNGIKAETKTKGWK
jgi:hypothetical protein